MGLCLSKRDVLIQKPHHSDQFLGLHGLHHHLHHHGGAAIFVPDSPSVSIVSTDMSSVAAAERHLLKNHSIGSTATATSAATPAAMRSSSASNMAECGSLREWRSFHRNSSAGSSSVRNLARSSSSDVDLDDATSGAARSSGFSYLSSPMVEAMDVYGLDSIARSYARARQRFELDSSGGGGVGGGGGGSGAAGGLNPRLLEIEEEHEEPHGEDSEYSSPCSGIVRKKSHAKSLHVFGEVFGESSARITKMAASTTPPPTIRVVAADSSSSSSFSAAAAAAAAATTTSSSKRSFELSVFGDDRHARNLEFERPSRDSARELGGSIDQPQHSVHVRSARWGFVLDSCGADEMEGGEELARMSTSVEPICKPSIAAAAAAAANQSNAFMAMAAGSREAWQHANFSFSHMNPSPPPPPAAMDSTLPRASDVDGSSSTDFSSSSNDFSSNLHSCHGIQRKFVASARDSSLSSSDDMYSSSAAMFQHEDDDGGDSDSSDDLFEIENLGKDFLLYPMNSAFLQDPDISYSSTSTAKSMMGFSKPINSSQSLHGQSVLGPTLRANVLVSSINSTSSNLSNSSRHRSSSSSDFQPPRKSLKARRKSSNGFYGISSMENDQSFYAR